MPICYKNYIGKQQALILIEQDRQECKDKLIAAVKESVMFNMRADIEDVILLADELKG